MNHKKLTLHTTSMCHTVDALLEDKTETVKVHVKHQDIVNVLIHFGKSMPILFFHTNTKSGLKKTTGEGQNPNNFYEQMDLILGDKPIYTGRHTLSSLKQTKNHSQKDVKKSIAEDTVKKMPKTNLSKSS
ncbi:hypothetical protein HCN44_011028 [Aphidius gifuensis]|uniref:Uncharacterized protein n=1 Tax=Aphidius gifuensis TaxID=684658 RepID=A0A834Y5M9_APHGI|nr:hypothetical protein HCN44_011028 [Aphidius gifuensis]